MAETNEVTHILNAIQRGDSKAAEELLPVLYNELRHAAAEAMRRILVEHARRKQSLKRGGEFERQELNESALVLSAPPDELLAVHEALEKLAVEDHSAAELVKLRYFVGMTMEEAAAALDMAPRSAERLWTYARAWLQREIRKQG